MPFKNAKSPDIDGKPFICNFVPNSADSATEEPSIFEAPVRVWVHDSDFSPSFTCIEWYFIVTG